MSQFPKLLKRNNTQGGDSDNTKALRKKVQQKIYSSSSSTRAAADQPANLKPGMEMAAVRLTFLVFLFSNIVVSFSISDSEALMKLKSSFENTGELSSWTSGSSPCKDRWVGVICFDGVVEGLHIQGLGLSGSINIEALQELRGLRTISFVNNSFTGPIPGFNKLGALKALLLTGNKFSGEVPSDYFSTMSSLKKVWLSGNSFTGPIPDSLMSIDHLMEIHLEDNQFSGNIPALKFPEMITSLDFSENNLEGQIPASYSKFSAASFQGNMHLCGKPLAVACSSGHSQDEQELAVNNTKKGSSSNGGMIFGLMVVVIIGFVAAASIFVSRRKNDDLDNFSVLESESVRQLEDPPRMSVDSNSSRRSESASKKGGSTKRGSQHNKHGSADLIMVNHEKGTFGMADLMKAAAEVLGNGGLGSAYKAIMTTGLSVVVKRMREMNTYEKEDFEAEMRRFGRIKHRNILTPLAYHYRKEEKLMVSEYLPKGSLLYILHGDRGISHAELTWPIRLKIIQGIARGLGYLHKEYSNYTLPHGNLKSSNVLLTSSYDPLLSDYALDPLTNPTFASQTMFAYKSPEYIRSQEISPKCDVYCLGIIILEVITGKFPSQYLSNGKGGIDVVQWVIQSSSEGKEQELIDPEIASDATSIDQMEKILRIGAACVESNPSQRLDMREAIRRIEDVHE